VTLFARFRAWLVSSVVAPELIEPSGVDITLDEDDLFEEHTHSTTRLKIGRLATMPFEPTDELLARDEESDEEITRRVDMRELEEKIAAASGRR